MLQFHHSKQIKNADLFGKLTHLIKELPLVKQLNNDDGIEDILDTIIAFKKKHKDVVIIGTGGSIMTAKTLEAIAEPTPQVHLLSNIDPNTVHRLLQKIDIDTTGFIVISKSGTTIEILALVEHLMSIKKDLSLLGITENTSNPLRALCKNCLDHPKDIGGRYSAFTAVGITPCVLYGLDPFKFRFGAECALDDFAVNDNVVSGATFSLQKPNHVYFAYCDRFTGLLDWIRQLIAESLGKNNKGITPITALGTIDQHSQLQLYLDGPDDKTCTFLTYKRQDDSTIAKLFDIQSRSTIKAFEELERAHRVIHFESIDEFHIGYFMMHSILEVLGMSILLDVNPFDQPAVEISKRIARTL